MVQSHSHVQDLSGSALVKRAKDIAGILLAQPSADEANGTLTPDTVAALDSAGMFGLKLPAVLGGDEADPKPVAIRNVKLWPSRAAECPGSRPEWGRRAGAAQHRYGGKGGL